MRNAALAGILSALGEMGGYPFFVSVPATTIVIKASILTREHLKISPSPTIFPFIFVC